jgi:hypothetical protein
MMEVASTSETSVNFNMALQLRRQPSSTKLLSNKFKGNKKK